VASEALFYPKLTDQVTYSRHDQYKYEAQKCFVMCLRTEELTNATAS